MPKSQRERLVSLTKTPKKGHEAKANLIQTVRDCADQYAYTYVFSVDNMRNVYLKDVRTDWKDSRFFLGSNRVMAVALGATEELEHRKNLRLIAERLTGNVGLLFTNRSPEAVKQYFAEFVRVDFIRGGAKAPKTVVLQPGPVKKGDEPIAHSLEPQLRKLGMPTLLKSGVVTLSGSHTLCTEGEVITHENAHLLKLLGIQLAEFRVHLLCMWHEEEFVELEAAGDGNDDGGDAAEDEDEME